MNRIFPYFSILWLGLFSILLATNSVDAQKRTEIKIGLILPLSGEWAFLGNGIRDGALLAEQDLKSKGTDIKLIFEDNHGELTASSSIAQKLINIEAVDGMISIISGVAKIIKPLAAKSKVLSIGICSDTDAADGRYSFVNYITAEQGVSKFLEYLHKTGTEKQSIGVLSLNEAGFLKIIDELKRQSRAPTELRFVETFDRGTTDFRSLLLKAKQAKAETFLILGLSPEIELLAKQARNLGITTPLTSIEGFGLASDKTPFEGSWFVDSGIPNSLFRQRFKTLYGTDVTPGVGHAYDSVMLIAEALEGSTASSIMTKREYIINKFRKIQKFEGVLGELSVQPNGVIWSNPSVKLIKKRTA